jgi:hypothetical protein
MARRLLTPFLRVIGADGLAVSGAKVYAYATGTTTPVNTYQAASGGSAHAAPVVADSGGLLAPIYVDDAALVRLIFKTSAGATILDVDPCNPVFAVAADSITDTELATGAAAANLGYTPANLAGDTFTGDVKLNFTETLATAAATDMTAKSAGFRGIPIITKDASGTIDITLFGKAWRHTNSTAYAWTIPLNATTALPIGFVMQMINDGSGAITITRGTAGVTLVIAGSGTSGDKTLAQYGVVTVEKVDTDHWKVSGAGVT